MQTLRSDFAADVVIVGASFAGAACALAAAQRGLRVCVLERKRDPGEKLRTTGIIVKEAAECSFPNLLPAAMTARLGQGPRDSPALHDAVRGGAAGGGACGGTASNCGSAAP